jgi:Fe-S-cluster containining protein
MNVQGVMDKYKRLVAELDAKCSELRARYKPDFPCGIECSLCCLNTSTLFISAVEALHLREGVERLPREIQNAIFEQARRASRRLLEIGHPPEELSRSDALGLLRGRSEGICPFLIGGVCACYDHRPIICRAWGYPLKVGDEVSCCEKTFSKEDVEGADPIDYSYYWEETQRLSKLLGYDRNYPMCYMVLKLCYLPLEW